MKQQGVTTAEDVSEAARAGEEPVRALQRTLTYRLHLLHKLTDQESQRRYRSELGLTLSDGRCLAAVGSFAPLSINDLARVSNLTKGQASRAAQSLVDQGLIEKTIDPDDGRGVVLHLTESGQRKWKAVMNLIAQRNEEIFGCLSAGQLQRFSELFDRLVMHAQRVAVAGIEEH